MPTLLALTAFLRSIKLLTCSQSFVLSSIQPVPCITPLVNSSVSFYNHSHRTNTHWGTNRIKAISPALFAEGYGFVSFDVESLFTTVLRWKSLKTESTHSHIHPSVLPNLLLVIFIASRYLRSEKAPAAKWLPSRCCGVQHKRCIEQK